mmetsp:Transcript_6018/g.10899  ORF Transcript_6018/g.10899 Transcript_6018/m.10899 type:complete len:238 (+) Transcript_6018:883-1596(+)
MGSAVFVIDCPLRSGNDSAEEGSKVPRVLSIPNSCWVGSDLFPKAGSLELKSWGGLCSTWPTELPSVGRDVSLFTAPRRPFFWASPASAIKRSTFCRFFCMSTFCVNKVRFLEESLSSSAAAASAVVDSCRGFFCFPRIGLPFANNRSRMACPVFFFASSSPISHQRPVLSSHRTNRAPSFLNDDMMLVTMTLLSTFFCALLYLSMLSRMSCKYRALPSCFKDPFPRPQMTSTSLGW